MGMDRVGLDLRAPEETPVDQMRAGAGAGPGRDANMIHGRLPIIDAHVLDHHCLHPVGQHLAIRHEKGGQPDHQRHSGRRAGEGCREFTAVYDPDRVDAGGGEGHQRNDRREIPAAAAADRDAEPAGEGEVNPENPCPDRPSGPDRKAQREDRDRLEEAREVIRADEEPAGAVGVQPAQQAEEHELRVSQELDQPAPDLDPGNGPEHTDQNGPVPYPGQMVRGEQVGRQAADHHIIIRQRQVLDRRAGSAREHPCAEQQRREHAQPRSRRPPRAKAGHAEDGADAQQPVRRQAEEKPGPANEALDHHPGRRQEGQVDVIHGLGSAGGPGEKGTSPRLELQGVLIASQARVLSAAW